MKTDLGTLFESALQQLTADGVIPSDFSVPVQFQRARQKQHGDFATNIALLLAKPAQRNPRELAELLVAALPSSPLIDRLEIAGPGFINVFLSSISRFDVVSTILAQGAAYGMAEPNSKRKIMVEFVSANPTGPLHVGHGRGAAYGDTLARVLSAAGNMVEREYYVNDAGRQMDILAVSVWLRYLQACEEEVAFPENAYQGDYIEAMAAQVRIADGDVFRVTTQQLQNAVSDLDEEQAMDALIALAKSDLPEPGFERFHQLALHTMLDDIRADLSAFGIDFDTWFSERSLFTDKKIDAVIEQLKCARRLYQKNGAWWFKSTDYGDEKDRVVVRENGQPTYFASDIAYHKDKLDRGFDEIINIWGADHHGYIARVKASIQALGLDADKLNVLLVQFAVLYSGGEKLKMSTRSGRYVTLRDLREDIGNDAARFFYAQRKSEQHMDFDLDLARSQSAENPVFYVQYAHARICSIFARAAEQGIDTSALKKADLSLLNSDHESKLVSLLQRLPEVIESAAQQYEPHQLTYYLREVATALQAYYNTDNILQAQSDLRLAKLALIEATRQVIENGLQTIGVSAPEKM